MDKRLEGEIQKVVSGNISEVSDSDLKKILSYTRNGEVNIKVKFELQHRQINKTIKWQKWVAIGTGALSFFTALMALATIILAIVTYIV
jgi:hypothetical protein